MIGTAFEEFAEAVSARRLTPAVEAVPRYQRITVLGGGRDAQLLAALCLAEGAEVTLFSAYGAELAALEASGGISIRGAGPIGTYQIDSQSAPSIRTTAKLDTAVAGAQIIFLTGPVHKQRTYAMVLAEQLRDGQVLVIAPGRSLGAAEAAWLLRIGGCKVDFTLVEVQGLPYWYAPAGTTLHLSPVATVAAATLPSGRNEVIAGLKRFLANIEAVHSTVHSGFADGSGLVEVPALLLGGPAVGDGLPAIPIGGVALDENRSFRALVGPNHMAVMHRMAEERRKVASRFGVRDLPALEGWLDVHAGTAKDPGRRPVPARAEAMGIIRCATIGSLIPLASAARACGQDVPTTEAMITLASSVLGANLANAGRRLETIGINADGVEDARRIMDEIMRGVR